MSDKKFRDFLKMLPNAIVAFLIFAAISVIVSYWLGFFFLNSLLIISLSLALTFVLIRKFKVPKIEVPKEIFIVSLITAFLCAHPLLLIHPFYMASNDSLHTITTRVLIINQKIPESYEPYAPYPFSYQIGFHLFAKLFVELFSFIPDYIVLWFFGVLLASIQPILIYIAIKELFNSQKTAFFIAALFVGTKFVFQNMLFGLFPRILASSLFFLFLYLLLKRNKLSYLLVPAVWMVHPGIAVNFTIFLGILVLFRKELFFPLLKALPFTFLAIPAFLSAVSTSAQNLVTMDIVKNSVVEFNLAKMVVATLLWMGWVPLILFIFSIFYSIYKGAFDKNKFFALSGVFIFWLLFMLASMKGFDASNILMGGYTYCAIIFSALTLSEIKISKNMARYVFSLILIFSLIAFFSSGYLYKYRMGSKITPEEAAFAFKFYEFDREVKPTVFFLRGAAKVAELSNKAPFNAAKGYFLPLSPWTSKKSLGFYQVLENQELYEQILQTKCVQCIYDLNVEYVVIDENYFPVKLRESPVLEYGSIKLYKLR